MLRSKTSLIRCVALGLVASSLCACEDEPASGQLIVRVDSDLALPKDLDLVRLDVTRGKQCAAKPAPRAPDA
jgi:hypothetical protein